MATLAEAIMLDGNWKNLAVPTASALCTAGVLIGLVFAVVPQEGMSAPFTMVFAVFPLLIGLWVFDRLSIGMDRAARRKWLRNKLPGIREKENRDAAERAREGSAAKHREKHGSIDGS